MPCSGKVGVFRLSHPKGWEIGFGILPKGEHLFILPPGGRDIAFGYQGARQAKMGDSKVLRGSTVAVG